MSTYYKIFDKGFDKILDLIKEVDMDLFDRFCMITRCLPKQVIDKTIDCEDFLIDNPNYNVEMVRTVNTVHLDYIIKKKYLRTNVCVRRFFEEDILTEDVDITLFELNQRNTVLKQPDLELYYEERDGEYKFVRTNDPKGSNFADIKWEIKLINKDEDFYLVSNKSIRGVNVSTIEAAIGYDWLYRYRETVDEYDEELEVEFKPSFMGDEDEEFMEDIDDFDEDIDVEENDDYFDNNY